MFKTYDVFTDAKGVRAAEILRKRLTDRGLTEEKGGYKFVLTVSENCPQDSYRITGGNSQIDIIADSLITLIGGIGAFLRDSAYCENGFVPGKRRGLTVPDCEIRGVYFANHFHNFYQTAPLQEIYTYIEDMALWGFNHLMTILPVINLKNRDDAECLEQMDRIVQIFKWAQGIGMGVSTCLSSSVTFLEYPPQLKHQPVDDPLVRHGNSGNVLCMSKPESMKFIDDDNRFILNALKQNGIELDIVWSWPYDEGGCGCPDCAPWGANGYLKTTKAIFKTAAEYYPNAKRLLSTWTFDTPDQGEWQTLTDSLNENSWCDIILADAHEDFPRYPLDNGVPGNLPMVSFPEISMWGLYPWGGYGAVGLPERFTNIWRQTEGKLKGEFLYSEGIYEDISKTVIAGLCQDYNRNPQETMAQYARYELGYNDTKKFIRLITLMEQNHVHFEAHHSGLTALSADALNIAKEIDSCLPAWAKNCWRWRILFNRILLDDCRYRGEKIADCKETLAAMHEIIEIFHCLTTYKEINHYHERVRPQCPEY